MNKLEKISVSVAVMAGSFAAVGGTVQAENGPFGDGDYVVKDLSETQRDRLVDEGILTCSVKPAIRDALGIVTLQEEYDERNYSRSGIDGIDGKKFCQDTYKIQIENGLYVDGVVGYQMVGFFGGLSSLQKEHGLQTGKQNTGQNEIKNETKSKPSCEQIRLTKWVSDRISGSDGDLILDHGQESRSVQKALNKKGVNVGYEDGIRGPKTLEGFSLFQKDVFGNFDCLLGSQTFKALGLNASNLENSLSTFIKKPFDPKADCPRPSSCDIKIDLSSQRMSILNTMGVTIWNIPIQSGKLGKESRSGRGKLGPVEYGLGRNPERYSIDYPEAILVNPRSIGNGGQKIHGSYSFNPNAKNSPKIGSAGCYRTENEDSFVIAKMPTGTDVFVYGAKPGTKQRYF